MSRLCEGKTKEECKELVFDKFLEEERYLVIEEDGRIHHYKGAEPRPIAYKIVTGQDGREYAIPTVQ